MKSESDIGNVGNDSFNAIATSFNLSIDDWHFVTVFRIIDRCRAGNIDNGTWAIHHFESCGLWNQVLSISAPAEE